MSAKDRTPTLRLLALAAFLLAAGLLALRAYDLFGTVKSEPVGSSVERQLTYLLEPITGTDRVRVSVTGRAPKTVLIMVDGDLASDLRPLRTRVENILQASIGFDVEADKLTLSQFPFARGVGGSLTPFQIAELTGLSLLSLTLLVILLSSQRQPEITTASPHRTAIQPPPRPQHPAIPMTTEPNDVREAAALAEANPQETANLVRGWLSYAED
ncbi:MAG: hypothetical protein ACX94B_07490 [Henriciella sp.]